MGYDNTNLNRLPERLDGEEDAIFKAAHSGMYVSLDGYAVKKKLYELVRYIRDTVPYLKLKVKPISICRRLDETYVDRIALCKEGTFYSLAVVEEGFHATDAISEPVSFESRLVTNNMYAKHSSGYYRLVSGDAKRLAKKAIPYIKDFSATEIARLQRHHIQDSARTASYQYTKYKDTLFAVISDPDTLIAEVSGLLAKGVEFVTPQFKEFAAKYEEVVREARVERNHHVNMYFVRLMGSGSDARVVVVTVRALHTYSPQFEEEKVYTAETMQTMPSIIGERISVLAVLDNNQYVHHVGMKIDDNHYWVEM